MPEVHSPKMFPIQIPYKRAAPHPLQIPWDVAELAYSVYSARFGRGQSLERIAERGGFSPNEMDDFVPNWRDRCSSLAAAAAEIKRLREAVEIGLHALTLSDSCQDEIDRATQAMRDALLPAKMG